jgi:hypothetical protein
LRSVANGGRHPISGDTRFVVTRPAQRRVHGALVKPPGLILPGPVPRQSSKLTSREIGVFVPPEALFPGIEATEATMKGLLGSLSRDAVLVACARLNTVVSGTGDPDTKVRQERAIGLVCSGEDLQRINAFAQTRRFVAVRSL